MRADTREWVRFAEADFEAAVSLMRKRKHLPANIVGFHCQQCVEKYLKARMTEDGLPVPKTHDLQTLLGLVVSNHPLLAGFHSALGSLTGYGVKFRYPGHVATRADAAAALKTCRSARAEIRLSLGLSRT
jgi:HEPN domain-containing protein